MKWFAAALALSLPAGLAHGQRFDVVRAEPKFIVTPAPEPEPKPAPEPEPEVPTLSYKEAYNLARQTGKPLVIWVGGNFCPECVKAESKDFVHYFTDFFPLAPAPGIVVGLPRGSTVDNIAVITSWPDGHIPTVRKAIKDFRDFGIVRTDVFAYGGGTFGTASGQPVPAVSAAPVSAAPVVRQPAVQQPVLFSQPTQAAPFMLLSGPQFPQARGGMMMGGGGMGGFRLGFSRGGGGRRGGGC